MSTVRIERYGSVEPLAPRLERFLCDELSGVSMDAIQHPSQMRVDFACLRGLLAVEIKSLEKDASKRLSNLTDELEQRDDWPLFYGEWPIESVVANLPDADAVKSRMVERLSRSIVDHFKKANNQLAAHATTFPRTNLVKLLVLINEDHEVYDPQTVGYVIQRAFSRKNGGQPKYRNIDAVLYLTERHAARIGSDIVFPVIAVSGPPTKDAYWKNSVIDFVAEKWIRWSGMKNLPKLPEEGAELLHSFAAMEHVPRRMRRQEKWELDYRRNPYMRSWSIEKIRDLWDEAMVIWMLGAIKDAPVKPSKATTVQILEKTTHLFQEIASRGLDMRLFKMEPKRMNAAASRSNVPSKAQAWLADYFGRKPMKKP